MKSTKAKKSKKPKKPKLKAKAKTKTKTKTKTKKRGYACGYRWASPIPFVLGPAALELADGVSCPCGHSTSSCRQTGCIHCEATKKGG